MARERTKTQSLALRLDPKTRFMLDFVSRVRGQPLTTVVERAITEAADKVTIGDFETGWRDIWSVSEGERALRMATYRELFPGFEEERRLAFCREHWPFFFHTEKCDRINSYYVDVLWPKIDEYVEMHDSEKQNDFYAAGKAMQDALKKAKLDAPEWPPAKKVTPKSEGGGYGRDLDDEIPF